MEDGVNRFVLVSIAALVASLALIGQAYPAEPAPSITGRYQADLETEVSWVLTLATDGMAQYVITELDYETDNRTTFVSLRNTALGHWKSLGNNITVTFPRNGVGGSIEYQLIPCPKDPPCCGGLSCLHGLKVITTDMPDSYRPVLWKLAVFNP